MEDPVERCIHCDRRLSMRQATIDWAPVVLGIIHEVLQFVWR
ncbi:hypothetical protein ACFRDV_22130 [Streptomyces fagopyri]